MTLQRLRTGWANLSLSHVWALAALSIVAAAVSLGDVQPNDFWWHVRVGQWIVAHGQIPTTDLFSFTRAGQPWAYQSWLMEVLFYLLLRVGGLPLVLFFQMVVLTATYALLLGVCWRASGDLRLAAWSTFAAAAVGCSNWAVRPQTISFLLFMLTLRAVMRLEADAESSPPAANRPSLLGTPVIRHAWWLPLLFGLWANAHGGFVFGLGLLGASLAASLLAWLRHRRPCPWPLFALTALCAAATLLTPLGLGMVGYVLSFLRHPVTQRFNLEFTSPTVRTLDGQLFFAFVLVWFALLLLAERYRCDRIARPSLSEALRWLLFGALALSAVRNEAWFALVAAPSLAAAWRRWSAGRGAYRPAHPGSRRLNRAAVVLLGLLLVCSLPGLGAWIPLPAWRRAYVSSDTCTGAVAALRRLPPRADGQPRRAFHSEACGSYMLWAIPELPVFVDTRIELYPLAQWEDYLALRAGRYDWQDLLAHYGIDTLLLARDAHKALLAAATASPDWQLVYEDERTVILQKRDAS